MQSLDHEIRTLQSVFWSERDPDGRAFVPLADAYRRAGDFRTAVDLLTEGTARHPDLASAHVVFARLYLEKGLQEEAELAARKVVALDADNVMGLEFLAGALEGRDHDAEVPRLRARRAELLGLAPDESDEAALELDAPAPDEPLEEVMTLDAPTPDEFTPPGSDESGDPVDDDLTSSEPVGDEPFDDEPFDDAAVLTRTMAELYARQGLTERAIEVLRHLREANPEDSGLSRRIAELVASLNERADAQDAGSTGGEPNHAPAADEDDGLVGSVWDSDAQQDQHEVETPFAWTTEDAEETSSPWPSIGSYFDRLLAWTPDDPGASS